MPQYREARRGRDFLEFCKNPELCAEAMLTAVEQLGVDAAILFSDLLVIFEPMGLNVTFTAGDGPKIDNPLREAKDVSRLRELENAAELGFVLEAVRKTREQLPVELPLIGFAGAPFTLAAYAVEGGSSRDYINVKRLMHDDGKAWNELMTRFARSVAKLLTAQLAAGAQVVQIFDSWVGCLAVEDYRRYVCPYIQTLINLLPPDAPIIYFFTGNPALILGARDLGKNRKNFAISLDWRIPLGAAREMIGSEVPLQGNLDPAVLLCSPDVIRAEATRILNQLKGQPGHIFNLGHGVLPSTPPENAKLLVDIIKNNGQ